MLHAEFLHRNYINNVHNIVLCDRSVAKLCSVSTGHFIYLPSISYRQYLNYIIILAKFLESILVMYACNVDICLLEFDY